MPFRDRTGPVGLGPRTGRAIGFCANSPLPGSENLFPGRGWSEFGKTGGAGLFRRGRGWRCQYCSTGLPGWTRENYGYLQCEPGLKTKEEVTVLQNHADFLKRKLEEIQNRIDVLERDKKQESE
jgi:hypothetical protein